MSKDAGKGIIVELRKALVLIERNGYGAMHGGLMKRAADWIETLERQCLEFQHELENLNAARPEGGPRLRVMPIVRTLKDQRDEVATVLREVMSKLREEFGPTCMDPEIDPHAWNLPWATLTARADAILDKCPSYEQQLRNVAEGIGMTYEELIAAMQARAEGRDA